MSAGSWCKGICTPSPLTSLRGSQVASQYISLMTCSCLTPISAMTWAVRSLTAASISGSRSKRHATVRACRLLPPMDRSASAAVLPPTYSSTKRLCRLGRRSYALSVWGCSTTAFIGAREFWPHEYGGANGASCPLLAGVPYGGDGYRTGTFHRFHLLNQKAPGGLRPGERVPARGWLRALEKYWFMG
jgi:hypothetical protein